MASIINYKIEIEEVANMDICYPEKIALYAAMKNQILGFQMLDDEEETLLTAFYKLIEEHFNDELLVILLSEKGFEEIEQELIEIRELILGTPEDEERPFDSECTSRFVSLVNVALTTLRREARIDKLNLTSIGPNIYQTTTGHFHIWGDFDWLTKEGENVIVHDEDIIFLIKKDYLSSFRVLVKGSSEFYKDRSGCDAFKEVIVEENIVKLKNVHDVESTIPVLGKTVFAE